MYWKAVNVLIVRNQPKTPGHLKICHSVQLINQPLATSAEDGQIVTV